MHILIYTLVRLSVFLIAPTICLAGNFSKEKPVKASALFEHLTRKVEDRYRRTENSQEMPAPSSHASAQYDGLSEDAKKRYEKSSSDKEGVRKLLKDSEDVEGDSRPILGKYKKYSDEWWDALFANCKGCTNSTKEIDPEKMLNDNPQWKEVAWMGYKAKEIIMKRALGEYNRNNDACNLACALSAGGDPDSRDDGNSHTALHLVCGAAHHRIKHYGLFNLLLRQGADPNLACQPAVPIEFVPDAWENELRKAGGGGHATYDSHSKKW
jgi:hypothetical protein